MSYRLFVLSRAEKQLAKLPRETIERLGEVIRGLAAEPRPSGCRKLRGRRGYRLRAGSFRVVYEIDDATRTVTVLDIGHRREVYR